MDRYKSGAWQEPSLPMEEKEESFIKWKICVYIRLSKEDTKGSLFSGENSGYMYGTEKKSESILNQRSILTSWIRDYFPPGTYEITGFFEDDGETGTDVSRKAFMEMLRVLEQGKGNCVVVKTLSRAFRNYSDQGYYLEEYFPVRNIRFISTMDSFVDTYASSEAVYSLDIPMYGVLNDRFAANTSSAVRRTFYDKRTKGKFIGAFPPWGFLKDPKDKNHLIPDPETAPIKVQMKEWIIQEGMSLSGVAKRLNSMGIPNPTEYKRLKGWNYRNPHAEENSCLWSAATVKNTLLNPVNLGHMVQGRQRVVSYKIHDKVPVPEKDWFFVENTHDSIFSQEDYDKLNMLLVRNRRSAKGRPSVHMLAGFVQCAACQRAMQRSHSRGLVYYKCRTRKENINTGCSVSSIREDRLIQAVYETLRVLVELFGKGAETLVQEIDEEDLYKYNGCLEKQKKERIKSFHQLQRIYDGLYGDWKTGILSREEYERIRNYYKREIDKEESAISNMEKEQERSLKEERETTLFQDFVRYGGLSRLTRLALVSFVKMIYVNEGQELIIELGFRDEQKAAAAAFCKDIPSSRTLF